MMSNIVRLALQGSQLCVLAIVAFPTAALGQITVLPSPILSSTPSPQTETLPTSVIEAIREDLQSGIDAGDLCGAVICIGDREQILFHEAFGFAALEPSPRPMTLDTVFDLASLTKPLATGLSIMRLVEDQKIELDTPVASYLPDFAQQGKSDVTLRHLLVHQSGLTPDNALEDYLEGESMAWERIDQLKLLDPPGTRFRYSDVGFLVLGRVVETVSGQTVDEFAATHFYRPLQLDDTGFNPTEVVRQRCITTEQRNGEWIQGEVHDPRAFALGGVAGHAGLFSTSSDLAVLAQTLLKQGEHQGVRIIAAETLDLMTSDQVVSDQQVRGLGWDKQSGYSSNRGSSFSPAAYGHGGFTGTSFWIDPELNRFVIFLGNRLHPDGEGSVNRLAGRIGDSVGEAAKSQRGEVDFD